MQVTLPFLIPANAMAAVELGGVSRLLSNLTLATGTEVAY